MRILVLMLVLTLGWVNIADAKKRKHRKKRKQSKYQRLAKLHSKIKHPLYHAVIKLNPSIDADLAFHYSNLFSRAGRKFKVDPYLLVAISMQESGISLDKVSTKQGYAKVNGDYQKVNIGQDFCMMQIHYSNIVKLDLDADRLTSNPKYCIYTGASILSGFRRYKKREGQWWTRYNASTGYKRKRYGKRVLRYYNRIMPIKNFAYKHRKSRRNLASTRSRK